MRATVLIGILESVFFFTLEQEKLLIQCTSPKPDKVQLKWKFNGFGFPGFFHGFLLIATDCHGLPRIATDFHDFSRIFHGF